MRKCKVCNTDLFDMHSRAKYCKNESCQKERRRINNRNFYEKIKEKWSNA